MAARTNRAVPRWYDDDDDDDDDNNNDNNMYIFCGIVRTRGRWTAGDRLKNVDGTAPNRTCLAKTSTLQNATTTTTTSSRREDDLLCAFACAQHIHTHAHARTHTRTRTHTHTHTHTHI